jgi:hypothetical protein
MASDPAQSPIGYGTAAGLVAYYYLSAADTQTQLGTTHGCSEEFETDVGSNLAVGSWSRSQSLCFKSRPFNCCSVTGLEEQSTNEGDWGEAEALLLDSLLSSSLGSMVELFILHGW